MSILKHHLRILKPSFFKAAVAAEGSDIDLVVISPDFRGKGLRRRLELLGTVRAMRGT
jgi:predicted nucleotidyltransferase